MKVASPVGTTWEEQVDKKQEKNIEYPKRKYSLVALNLHKKVSVQFAKKHTQNKSFVTCHIFQLQRLHMLCL
jgi:hypothetical protein